MDLRQRPQQKESREEFHRRTVSVKFVLANDFIITSKSREEFHRRIFSLYKFPLPVTDFTSIARALAEFDTQALTLARSI